MSSSFENFSVKNQILKNTIICIYYTISYIYITFSNYYIIIYYVLYNKNIRIV